MTTLPSGALIPNLGWGIGTAWFNPSPEKVKRLQVSIKDALDAGFRHIDSAQMYKNEKYVGSVISQWTKDSGVPRSELFITGKVWNSHREPSKLRESLMNTLKELELEYLDLYLIHSPFQTEVPLSVTWAEMEKIKSEGLVKDIGVSNFQVEHLEELLKSEGAQVPALNQIEYSAYLQQPELLKFCQEKGIVVSSYGGLSPILKLKGGPLDEVLEKLGTKYKSSPMLILQTWIRSNGVVVITTTGKKERMSEILGGVTLSMEKEDIDMITKAGGPFAFRLFWGKEMPCEQVPW